MEGSIEIEEEKHGDLILYKFSGRLDAVSSPFAYQKIFDEITAGRTKFIFDFSGLTYLSSAGIRVLLKATSALKPRGGALVLCNIDEKIMGILELSGFDHVLEISLNKNEALAKF